MAGIDRQISDRMMMGEQALQQRYAQSQELIDLLALQALSKEKDEKARAIQASMQANPATVRDQLEQKNLAANRQGIASMMPGVQMQGKRMQQAQARQMAGIPSQPAPNMARMAKGGIVAFQEGGMPVANPNQPRPTMRATQRLSPDAMSFLDLYRTKEAALKTAMDDAERAAIEANFIRTTENIAPDAKMQAYQYLDSQENGMYGGGEVGYAPGGSVTNTNDAAMYAIEDVLGGINAQARNAGQRIVGYDGQGNPITAEKLKKITGLSEKEYEYENPRSNYTVRDVPERDRKPADIGNVDDAVQALLDSMRPRGGREERTAPEPQGPRRSGSEIRKADIERNRFPETIESSTPQPQGPRRSGWEIRKAEMERNRFPSRQSDSPASQEKGIMASLIEYLKGQDPASQAERAMYEGIVANIPRAERSATSPAPASAPAPAPEQDIVGAMEEQVVMPKEPIPTGRDAFLGAEDAARQDKVDAEVRKGREIDWDLLRELGAGMAGQTSVGGALGAGARAVGEELRRREGIAAEESRFARGLAAEESRFARELAAKEGISQQQLDMFKDELNFKRDQLTTTQERQKFDIAKDIFDQTARTKLAEWVAKEGEGWFTFEPNEREQQAFLMGYFEDLLKAQGISLPPTGTTTTAGQSGITEDDADLAKYAPL